ncbi:MAG: hypothetical protein LBS91_09410 [Clostridiales Family XIII bacterium]|nr:hypothetical protein [Clostridiales Family XIII bacterium]
MEQILEIAINESSIRPYEIAVVMETVPGFLPPATLAEAGGKRVLLYSCEGLVPLARYGAGPGGAMALGALFDLLCGYIRCLLAARDRLLDTRLLSSDPERGIFAAGAGGAVKAVWGADALADEGEKICRVAEALAKRERVMGAKPTMEKMIKITLSENLSLKHCLKAAESLCREWNHIVRPA